MKKTKVIPNNAHLIPGEAKCVFTGMIHDVYQWEQKMFDGSLATFEMIKRPDTVVAAIVEDGKLMLLRQLQPDWKMYKYGFPGGRVDSGETPLEAIKREVKEETGRTYKNWRLINVYQPQEKVERFNYFYLATEEKSRESVHHDIGEVIEEPIFMTTDDIRKLSESNARLEEWEKQRIGTVEELLAKPEYQGQEVEIN